MYATGAYSASSPQFIELGPFSKERERFFTDDDLLALQRTLSQFPESGDVIPGSGGLRKLRWARKGMGKRGGLRIIYYVQDQLGRIWLVAMYAKSEQENMKWYGSHSSVTLEFKDMGNTLYPAWMSSLGGHHALEGCETDGPEGAVHS